MIMEISPYTREVVIGVGFGMGVIGLIMSSGALGAYNTHKSYLINRAIHRENVDLTEEKERKEEVYRVTLDKIIDSVFGSRFGCRLAEKRFKKGKFDKIIEKYKFKRIQIN